MNASPESLCPGCFAAKGSSNPCPHCGYDEFARRGPLVLPHRTLLDRQFLVGRVLGKPGGFGITYLGWDQRLETRVAIKEYLPRELAGRDADRSTVAAHSGDDAELFRFGLDQFLREARTLAQLDHPNIVRVRQFFEANGTAYLVMDYYEGLSFAEYLDQEGGKLPEQTSVQLMLPILDGLRAVHAKGFLHRDVKPANIYLAKTDTGGTRPILLDFGAARQAMGERSRSLSVVVSEGYAPFEQYQRKGQQGPWSDIYSAAAVLYRAVTGQEPPEATARIPDDELLPASDFGVSQSLSAAICAALSVSAQNRPQTIQRLQGLLLVEPDDLALNVHPTSQQEQIATTSLAVEESQARTQDLASSPEPELTQQIPIPRQTTPRKANWLLIAFALSLPLFAFLFGEPIRDFIKQNIFNKESSGFAFDGASDETSLETLVKAPTHESDYPDLSNTSTEGYFDERASRVDQGFQTSAVVDSELLATCRDHMGKMEYTHPDSANALLCYRQVMIYDPSNAAARDALATMIAFYISSAEKAMRNGDVERVRDRIARLRKIDWQSEHANRIEEVLQEFETTAGPQCDNDGSVVELTICKNRSLQSLTNQMAAIYNQLQAVSTIEEASMLWRAQEVWIADREKKCGILSGSSLTSCIENSIADRIKQLRIFDNNAEWNGGSVMPFFLIQPGSLTRYDLDGQFLRFVSPTGPGEKAWNNISQSIFEDAPRETEEPVHGSNWEWQAKMTLSLLTSELMSVKTRVWGYTGGAHGYSHETNHNIDMRIGRLIEVTDIFSSSEIRNLNTKCYEQLIAEKRKKLINYDPQTDGNLNYGAVAKTTSDIKSWSFDENGAEIYFGEYSVGSYAEGTYRCRFSKIDLISAALSTAPLPWASRRTTGFGSIASSDLSRSRLYVSAYGDEYQLSENEHGVVLKSDNATLYLGKACDAYSPEVGTGSWGWSASGFVARLESTDFSFPRYSSPIGNQSCQITWP